jgi:hypothetical protein
LHIEELRNILRKIKSRRIRRFLVGNPEQKRPLGRPKRGWKDNIQMDLREI